MRASKELDQGCHVRKRSLCAKQCAWRDAEHSGHSTTNCKSARAEPWRPEALRVRGLCNERSERGFSPGLAGQTG
eukprot:4667972-Heterocapsa_arctica.AAC.1